MPSSVGGLAMRPFGAVPLPAAAVDKTRVASACIRPSPCSRLVDMLPVAHGRSGKTRCKQPRRRPGPGPLRAGRELLKHETVSAATPSSSRRAAPRSSTRPTCWLPDAFGGRMLEWVARNRYRASRRSHVNTDPGSRGDPFPGKFP
jgi:hypothetical protein